MSRNNLETLRRLIDLWAAGPTDVPTDLVASDVEFVSPLTSLRGRPYRGYDGARERFFTDRRAALEAAGLRG